MKKAVFLLALVLLASCSTTNTQWTHRPPGVGNAPDPGRTDQIMGAFGYKQSRPSSACHDSAFVALKLKPFAEMSAWEHAYFQQKYDECMGLNEEKDGSTPEWIIAIILILETVAAIVLVAKVP